MFLEVSSYFSIGHNPCFHCKQSTDFNNNHWSIVFLNLDHGFQSFILVWIATNLWSTVSIWSSQSFRQIPCFSIVHPYKYLGSWFTKDWWMAKGYKHRTRAESSFLLLAHILQDKGSYFLTIVSFLIYERSWEQGLLENDDRGSIESPRHLVNQWKEGNRDQGLVERIKTKQPLGCDRESWRKVR